MPVDLHVHTAASDGTVPAPRVVAMAIDAGLSAVAITDHDTVEGVGQALETALGTDLEVIAGLELSAQHAGQDVHILGYFLDRADRTLASALAELRQIRVDRARAMVSALRRAGYGIGFENVMSHAGDGSVGRAHVARALLDAGVVETIEEAFSGLIGAGRPFFIEKPLMAAADAVALIRSTGGVAVLAHPAVSRAEHVVAPLVVRGLQGIEVFHPGQDDAARTRLLQLARTHSLVTTGGSDFHGPGTKGARLGAGATPPESLEELRALAGR